MVRLLLDVFAGLTISAARASLRGSNSTGYGPVQAHPTEYRFYMGRSPNFTVENSEGQTISLGLDDYIEKLKQEANPFRDHLDQLKKLLHEAMDACRYFEFKTATGWGETYDHLFLAALGMTDDAKRAALINRFPGLCKNLVDFFCDENIRGTLYKINDSNKYPGIVFPGKTTESSEPKFASPYKAKGFNQTYQNQPVPLTKILSKGSKWIHAGTSSAVFWSNQALPLRRYYNVGFNEHYIEKYMTIENYNSMSRNYINEDYLNELLDGIKELDIDKKSELITNIVSNFDNLNKTPKSNASQGLKATLADKNKQSDTKIEALYNYLKNSKNWYRRYGYSALLTIRQYAQQHPEMNIEINKTKYLDEYINQLENRRVEKWFGRGYSKTEKLAAAQAFKNAYTDFKNKNKPIDHQLKTAAAFLAVLGLNEQQQQVLTQEKSHTQVIVNSLFQKSKFVDASYERMPVLNP